MFISLFLKMTHIFLLYFKLSSQYRPHDLHPMHSPKNRKILIIRLGACPIIMTPHPFLRRKYAPGFSL